MVAQQRGWERLNVNLRLSERLLELTQKQRKLCSIVATEIGLLPTPN